MKVLHILNTSKYSGAENVVITLINALKDKIEFVYASPNGPISEVLELNNIEYYSLKENRATFKEIKKCVDKIKPDIIHAHDYTVSILCSLLWTKTPIICHLHNNSPWLRSKCAKSLAFMVACKRSSKILTVSDSVMDEYIFGDKYSSKTIVVDNPNNITRIRNMAQCADLNDSSDVVFLGRLSLQKNPIAFIEIIREVAKKRPDIKAIMVGDGEMRDQVEKRIEGYGLENNLKLYGFQKNPYGLLNNSHLMCMPSLWEGYGLAAVEALALGKPVVASPVGGVPRIVNNTCGYLCESEHDFAEKVYKALSDEEEYCTLSKGANARAGELDNLIDYSRKIYETYCGVLNKS